MLGLCYNKIKIRFIIWHKSILESDNHKGHGKPSKSEHQCIKWLKWNNGGTVLENNGKGVFNVVFARQVLCVMHTALYVSIANYSTYNNPMYVCYTKLKQPPGP